MSMTKADFELLAENLKKIKPKNDTDASYHPQRIQWGLDCSYVANACQKSNPKFNRKVFLVACGMGD